MSTIISMHHYMVCKREMVWKRIAVLASSLSMKPVCRKSYNLKATAENSPLISNLFRSMLQKMVKWLTSSFYGVWENMQKTCKRTLAMKFVPLDMQKKTCVCVRTHSYLYFILENISHTMDLVFNWCIWMKDTQRSNKFSKLNYSIALDIK